jgi:hypothetical protein
MLLKISCFNQKQAKYGVAAIGAMEFALDIRPVVLLHLPEGLIRLGYQELITLKQVGEVHV